MRSLAATAGSPQVHKEAGKRVQKLLQYGCHEPKVAASARHNFAQIWCTECCLTCQSVLAVAALVRISAAVLQRSASSPCACQLCTCKHSNSCEPGPQQLGPSAEHSQCLANSRQTGKLMGTAADVGLCLHQSQARLLCTHQPSGRCWCHLLPGCTGDHPQATNET